MKKDFYVVAAGTGYTQSWENEQVPLINTIYIINGGTGTYTENGVTRPFKKGYAYFLPATCSHIRSQDEENPLDHTFVNFIYHPMFQFNRVYEIPIDLSQDLYTLFSSMELIVNSLSSKHHTGFYWIDNISENSPSLRLLGFCMKELLHTISKTYSCNSYSNKTVNTVITYIHEHYAEKITLEDLAEQVYLNKCYLIKLFKETMHCTPYQYLQSIRVNHALAMKAGGMSYSEIAEKTGFTTLSSLYRALKTNYREI